MIGKKFFFSFFFCIVGSFFSFSSCFSVGEPVSFLGSFFSVGREIIPKMYGVGNSFFFRNFIFSPYMITGDSMAPLVSSRDVIFVNMFAGLMERNIGDVVLFDAPEEFQNIPRMGYWGCGVRVFFQRHMRLGLEDGECVWRKSFVKRIIGMPGDVIEFRDGIVFRNGEVLEEEYLGIHNRGGTFPQIPYSTRGTYHVPEGKFFVLGDNRTASFDSRQWKYPYISEERVYGGFYGGKINFNFLDLLLLSD